MERLKDPTLARKLIDDERRLKEAEKLAKIGYWEFYIDEDRLIWSDEIYRIFEVSPDDFGATYDSFLEFIHPDDREFVNESFTNSVNKREPYGPITHRLLMKNGVIKFVEERGSTDYNEFGQPIRSFGVVQDITERVMGEKTKAMLREKELLLKEIYHRVKNNLQLVSSLLHIQSLKIEDASVAELFLNSQNRINSIALIHEHLLRSENLATVYINEYVEELVGNLKDAISGEHSIKFDLQITDSQISLDMAVPLGLIINEVVSNCIKHAFPDKSGTVFIQIKKSLSGLKMYIKDDGVGIDDITNYKDSNSFGLEIIHDLTDQLDGDFKIESEKGKGVRYSFILEN